MQLQVAGCADLQFGLPPGNSLELLIEKNANYINIRVLFFYLTVDNTKDWCVGNDILFMSPNNPTH